MKINKNKYILFGVIAVFIVVGVVAFGISFAFKDNGNFLRNQKVDGLSFENAKVEYKNSISTFTVIVYNENKDTYEAESVNINLKDKNGKVTTLIGNIGGSLESDEGRLISATTNSDITDMASLEYIINK